MTDPQAWSSLATLSVLEIVLGIDNIIFLSIVSARLPVHQQQTARRIGLGLALLARILLLFSLTWMIGLTAPILAIGDFEVSWRDIVLGGGLFLLVKGTIEMHHMLEGYGGEGVAGIASFAAVITQIVMLDLVFSLDSVITAIGIAEHIPIMVAAIVIAMIIMLLAAEPTARFVNAHPTVKMLALSFLLVGVALIAHGLHFHIRAAISTSRSHSRSASNPSTCWPPAPAVGAVRSGQAAEPSASRRTLRRAVRR